MFLSRLLGSSFLSSSRSLVPGWHAVLLMEVCGAHPQLCSDTGCPALSGQAGVAGLLPGTLAAQTLWDVAPSRDGVFETGRNRFAF